MRVLYLTPTINKFAVSEPFVAFKWAEALSEIVDLTILCFHPTNPDHGPLEKQLPKAEIVSWPKPQLPRQLFRLEAMLKPTYPVYARRVRRWLAEATAEGRRFDIAHQIMPQAARYATPLRGSGIPYVMGPLGGSLTTPDPFRAENAQSSSWFTALRNLDQLRFRHDPALRASYAEADLILGVAPYVEDMLSAIPLKRFAPVLELGVETLPPRMNRQGRRDRLELLHVGRGVRTKGLRDAVRALAHLKDLPDIHLTSAGTGPEIEICRAEAQKLGVSDRVTFAGQLPRTEVDTLYARADIFVFPSFREAAGNVVYEAMSHGLPVIGADRGGPAFIIDDSFGRKIPVTDPETYARDIAAAIRALHADPDRRQAMGAAARDTLARDGLWPVKARRLKALYENVVAARHSAP
jgi:glycosyltransferase involved in cell wall biosynthesis